MVISDEPAQKRQKLSAPEEGDFDDADSSIVATQENKFVPIHGNYRGYYSKRTSASGLDQRLKLVPSELVKHKVRSMMSQEPMPAC